MMAHVNADVHAKVMDLKVNGSGSSCARAGRDPSVGLDVLGCAFERYQVPQQKREYQTTQLPKD